MGELNPSGLLLVVAGIFILTQVLGGNALNRLNVTNRGEVVLTEEGPKAVGD